MKRILLIILAAAIVLALGACKNEVPLITQTGVTDTEFEGVTVKILNVIRTEADLILEIEWSNGTDHDVLYGEFFGIQRLENGEWTDLPSRENTGFTAIGYMLKAHTKAQENYPLAWIYDVSEPGTYRFVSDCTVYDSSYGTKCDLWAEFTVGESLFDETEELHPQQPPRLDVKIGTESLEAAMGSYSWFYTTGEGLWSRVEAESSHPLQMGNLLQNHETTEEAAKLEFEIQPDSYTIRCWPDSMLRYGDVRLYEDKCQDLVTNLYTVYLEPSTTGGYIYEVTATWKDDGGPFHGTATYVFYATSYPVDPLDNEIMPR